MKALTIQQAARAVGASTAAEGSITDVCIDNRTVTPGSLFVCIRGERFDGHDFAADALQKGAAAVLCQRDLGVPAQLLVPDTRRALLDLAQYYRGLFDIPVTAVTGSVGKTTVKEMTAAVFARKFKTLKTEGNLNNGIGLPRTLFRLETDTEAAVIEMGMNHFGEISRLSRTAMPTMGVIGNIGVSHIENLGSREGILKAKLEILDGMAPGTPLILNGDDPLLRTVRTPDHPIYLYGIENTACRFQAYDIEPTAAGSRFTVDFGCGEQRVELPAMGRHSIYNALAAFAAGFLISVPPEAAALALADYTPAGMRQRLHTAGEVRFIEDCYNASPDSVRAALQTLRDMRTDRRIAVLGDMLELGDVSPEAHRQSGAQAAAAGVDILLTYGEASVATHEEAVRCGVPAAKHFDDKQTLAQTLLDCLKPGDTVLVKASRGMKMEDILQIVYKELEA